MTSGVANAIIINEWPYNAPYEASCNHCIGKGLPKVEYQDYCEPCNNSRREPIPVSEVRCKPRPGWLMRSVK